MSSTSTLRKILYFDYLSVPWSSPSTKGVPRGQHLWHNPETAHTHNPVQTVHEVWDNTVTHLWAGIMSRPQPCPRFWFCPALPRPCVCHCLHLRLVEWFQFLFVLSCPPVSCLVLCILGSCFVSSLCLVLTLVNVSTLSSAGLSYRRHRQPPRAA